MNAAVGIKAYASVGLESNMSAADPHKLILMLYEGALLAIANARNAILRKDVPAKAKAISHAIRIIEEGLRASLNKDVGGKLAQDLDGLYSYMCVRLVNANAQNDVAMLDEVTRLLSEIKEAWEAIRPTVLNQPVTTAQPPFAPGKPSLVYERT